jgi:hypothetical protein
LINGSAVQAALAKRAFGSYLQSQALLHEHFMVAACLVARDRKLPFEMSLEVYQAIEAGEMMREQHPQLFAFSRSEGLLAWVNEQVATCRLQMRHGDMMVGDSQSGRHAHSSRRATTSAEILAEMAAGRYAEVARQGPAVLEALRLKGSSPELAQTLWLVGYGFKEAGMPHKVSRAT